MPPPELPATRALGCLYLPAPQRLALTKLTGIEAEIRSSLRAGLDHRVAHTRLAWWRDECERTAAGQPSHPLTRALASILAPAGVGGEALAGLTGLVTNAAWDLACATFDSRPELTAYCERWSAALITPLVQLAVPHTAPARALELGTNLHALELLLDVASDARSGRLRVPLDELARAAVAVEVVARPPWPATLADLLATRHREIRAALGAAVEALAACERKALRGLIVWVTLACIASRRAEKRLPQAGGMRHHHAALDGWRAWRAARRVEGS